MLTQSYHQIFFKIKYWSLSLIVVKSIIVIDLHEILCSLKEYTKEDAKISAKRELETKKDLLYVR